jgi:hypothetical protein
MPIPRAFHTPLAATESDTANLRTVNRLANLTPHRRPILALTQIWCSPASSRSPDQASLKQIDLAPAVHLPLHQFEFRDLTFGLPVGPWQCDGGPNG